MSRLTGFAAPALALLLSITGTAVLAQTDTCSEQLVRQVEMRLPPLEPGLDVRDLSCAGITEIYFILNEDHPDNGFALSQEEQIEAVFRREGLLD